MPTSDEMFEFRPLLEADARKKKATRKIERMHVIYGKHEGAKCGDCVHFYGKSYARTYHKCELFGDSGGPATDWLVHFVACGKFEPRGGEGQDVTLPSDVHAGEV
jgi:hypothetical protein